VRAVTVDLWYTLFYLHPRDQRALAARREQIWVDACVRAGTSPGRARRLVRARLAWGLTEEARGRAPSLGRQARWLGRRLGQPIALSHLVLELDSALLEAPVHVFPGARAALARLRRADLRVGLVSNIMYETPQATLRLLRRSGVRRLLDAAVLSSDTNGSKPSARPFRLCLQRLGRRAASAVHIGDHPFDAIGARRAGMRFVRFAGRPRVPRRGPARTLAFPRGTTASIERWDDLSPGLWSLGEAD
jgi:FMN phosphatase YigB (HAD superfamily)